jgi:hypothetical protein
MKIIQSFAQFDEGSPYVSDTNVYLNFHSFLLSYLTLNKYYGHVTMICNQKAHDTFIKYIPYEETKIVESSYDFELWGAYKVDAMKAVRGGIIHVDPDVFIFADIFGEFIKKKEYDVIIQNYNPPSGWIVDLVVKYIKKNAKFLADNDIITMAEYDDRYAFGGVSGHKHGAKKLYLETVAKLEAGIKKGEIEIDNPMILEEVSIHLTALKNKLNVYEILPYDLVQKHGQEKVGGMVKYTHMVSKSKYIPKYVELIKVKIIKDFPEQKGLVEHYEAKVLGEVNVG